MEPRPWSDERVGAIIGTLLRTGVMLAAAIVSIGGAIYLVRHGAEPADYSRFQGEPADLTSLGGILGGIGALRGRSIVQFGLLLLAATPVARVLFAAAAFALQRDRTYVVITLAVLTVLLFSLSGGLGGH